MCFSLIYIVLKKGNIVHLEEILSNTFKCRSIKQAGLSKNKKLSTNVTLILFRSRNEFFTIYATYTVKKAPNSENDYDSSPLCRVSIS